MIEEHGRVVAVERRAVWVETIRKTTCSSCSAKNGCGQHLVEKYKSNKSHSYIRATNDSDSVIQKHDEVIIGLPEGSLMKASVVVYLLPLMCMLAVLWLTSFYNLSDLTAVILALFGLAVGLVPVRLFGQRAGDMCKVQVMKVIPRRVYDSGRIPLKAWTA